MAEGLCCIRPWVRCSCFQTGKLSPLPKVPQPCFPRYLIDQHATGHGESGLGGEMAGDHDSKASLGEGKLVRAGWQQLIYHDHWCFAVDTGWGIRWRIKVTLRLGAGRTHSVFITFLFLPLSLASRYLCVLPSFFPSSLLPIYPFLHLPSKW